MKYGYAKALPAAADYDGDGLTDLTVYRPGYGEWFIRLSTTGQDRKETCGLPAPVVPVPGDYDRDGLADLAIFQRETAVWKVRPSGGGGPRQSESICTAPGGPQDQPAVR